MTGNFNWFYLCKRIEFLFFVLAMDCSNGKFYYYKLFLGQGQVCNYKEFRGVAA